MEEQVILYAVHNYESARPKPILYFTEWDDALSVAEYKEPSVDAGFNYTLISEFYIDEALLEDIRMNDTEALSDCMGRSTIINQHYFK
jgi:hypothetical protein